MAVGRGAATAARLSSLGPSAVQRVGVYVLGLFVWAILSVPDQILLSHVGWTPRIRATSAVLSLTFGLASLAMFRGLRLRAGRFWVAFCLWMGVAVPFSAWRGGSFSMFLNTVGYEALVFAACALAVTLKQVRTLIYFCIAGALAVLFYCLQFGSMEGGRLVVGDSSLSNPNGLGFHLLMCSSFLLFLVFQQRLLLRLLGVAALAAALVCILRTGSRGTFVSLLVVAAGLFFVIPRLAKFWLIVLLCCGSLVALLATPASTLRRLTLIFVETEGVEITSEEDGRAVESQISRQELLKKAIELTLTHPLVGVGPGQFSTVVLEEAKSRGEHIVDLKQHNTYTQVSSEMGLPALFFYCAALAMCIRMNYQVAKRAWKLPGQQAVVAQSLCLFVVCLAYAANTMFVHSSELFYHVHLIGLSMANFLAARDELGPFGPAPIKAPSALVKSPV
jgi:O-antigen ligase